MALMVGYEGFPTGLHLRGRETTAMTTPHAKRVELSWRWRKTKPGRTRVFHLRVCSQPIASHATVM